MVSGTRFSSESIHASSSTEFRQSYRKRWKTNSKLVGFTTSASGFNLLATSKLGRIMNENRSAQLPGDFFITKSGEGDGLILYGSPSQNTVYVSKANMNEKPPIRPLRIPNVNDPKHFYYKGIAILSQEDDSYKVIMVGRENYIHKVMIQTYSSSTGEWQLSEPLSPPGYIYASFRCSVIASSKRGVVYWPGEDWVTSYDANNGCISNIYSPESIYRRNSYGLSPQGYLQCATSPVWGFEHDFIVHVCELDDDKRVWNDFHSEDSDSLPQGVSFVSLVPGRSDCIFVKLAGQLSLYNFHTHELATICHLSDERWDDGANKWVPLTMADLRVWPSSPFPTRQNLISIPSSGSWRGITMATYRDFSCFHEFVLPLIVFPLL